MLRKFKRKVKPVSHLLWLFLLLTISVLVTNFYERNKNSQYDNLIKTLNNLYFQKSLAKITSSLQDRFTEIEYLVKEGDNYETIINQFKITKKEKKILLETIKKNENIKILRPNQKISFKVDKKDDISDDEESDEEEDEYESMGGDESDDEPEDDEDADEEDDEEKVDDEDGEVDKEGGG